jgi:hypothetical protein
MWSNPVFLIAAGIAALIAGVVVAVSVFKKYNAEQKIAEKLTGDVSYKIQGEQKEMNRLFDALQKTNPKSEERKKLLQEMKEKYPDFLDYQKLEVANENDLEEARKNANDELARTIRLQSYKEQYDASMKAIEDNRKKFYDKAVEKGFKPEEITAALDKAIYEINAGKWQGTYGNTDQERRIVGSALDMPRDIAGNYYFHKNTIAGELFSTVFGESLSDVVDNVLEAYQKVKSLGDYTLAGGATQEQLMAMVNGTGSGAADKKNTKLTTQGAEATATGGTRNTQITITMGKIFENMVFNGGITENAKDIERKIEECLLRVLYAAQNAG